MKFFLFLLQCLVLIPWINAQDAGFQWVGTFGSFDPDNVDNILVDSEGNTYTVGNFQNTVDFDPGPDVFEIDGGDAATIFILKLNAEGNFEWCKTFGNTFYNFCFSITFDLDENIVGVGAYQGTVDFDPGVDDYNLTSAGVKDYFILKLDQDGEFVSALSVGGLSNETALRVVIDPIGDIYIAGFFTGITDFDPGPGVFELSTSGDDDVFIQKLTSDGSFMWVRSFGGTLEDIPRDLQLDADGNIFLCGQFRGSADFDPGVDTFIMTSDGFEDGFILKLNELGNFEWAAKIGGEFGGFTRGCAIDSEGNVYSVGSYTGSTDFDPGVAEVIIPSLGLSGAYIQKLNNEGEFIFVKTINTVNAEVYYDIVIDETDEIYLTGLFSGTVDFDASAAEYNGTSNGSLDFFVQHLDSEGAFIWVKTAGGEEDDIGEKLAVTNEGDVYITGRYRETVDFDPNAGVAEQTSNGNTDIFILKLTECTPDETNDVITACNSYTWIDGTTYSENNNAATWLLSNVGGCDSLVTLDLTIVELDNSVSATAGIISSADLDADYQWLDCNDEYSEIIGEISQEFTPTIDGDYAVRIEQGSCVDTSECITIDGVGINEALYDQSIILYPNPNNGHFIIQGLESIEYRLIVYSITGKQIKKQAINGVDQFEVILPKGQYVLELISDRSLNHFSVIVFE